MSEDDAQPCDCELPGYFYCGVPGILARLEQGRLVLGAAVERCDLCQRYPDDAVAYRRLVELGIEPGDQTPPSQPTSEAPS